MEFNIAIIGAGLVGSSCAKYIAESVEKFLLVGPKFHQDGIFGAWLDEGRIVQRVNKDPVKRNLGRKHTYIKKHLDNYYSFQETNQLTSIQQWRKNQASNSFIKVAT